MRAHEPEYRGDAISRRLDTITLEEHVMEQYGISRETVRTFLSPDEGGGLRPRARRTLRLYRLRLRMLHPLDISDETGTQMFPDGNGGIARLIVKTLIPESIAGRSFARRCMPQCRELCGPRSRRSCLRASAWIRPRSG